MLLNEAIELNGGYYVQKMENYKAKDDWHGRPCNNCTLKKTCEDVECKRFIDWVNSADTSEPVDDHTFTVSEVSKITGKSLKQVRRLCEAGAIPYKIQKNKIRISVDHMHYFDKEEDLEDLEGLITSKDIYNLTGINKTNLDWYLRSGRIRTSKKVSGINYFKPEVIDEIKAIKRGG